MKTRITQKEVKATHRKVFKVGYCRLQTLLKFTEPYAYTCGNDGWHSDVYSIGSVAISTGYQPFGEAVDYRISRWYEYKAQEIIGNVTIPYDDRVKAINNLLNDFIGDCINGRINYENI